MKIKISVLLLLISASSSFGFDFQSQGIPKLNEYITQHKSELSAPNAQSNMREYRMRVVKLKQILGKSTKSMLDQAEAIRIFSSFQESVATVLPLELSYLQDGLHSLLENFKDRAKSGDWTTLAWEATPLVYAFESLD